MSGNQLIRLNQISKAAGVGLIQAFHCGRDIGDGQFNIDYLGSGEGMAILGPGVYFITSQRSAEGYAEYHQSPFLYSVTLDTTNFYEDNTGKPEHVRDTLFRIIGELEVKLNRKIMNKNYESLKYGRGAIGDINKAVGPKECHRLLVENGVDGALERLPTPSLIELCVFNMNCIKSFSKIPFADPVRPRLSRRNF